MSGIGEVIYTLHFYPYKHKHSPISFTVCSSSWVTFDHVWRKHRWRERQCSTFDKWSQHSLRVRDNASSKDFTQKDRHFIQKETPHRNSCCLVRMKPHVARLWDFSRNATIWIMWISRSLNVGSLGEKKHNTAKHTDKTKHACRLGLAVGPPVCNLWQRSRDLHYVLERLQMSSRAGAENPLGEICEELGEGVWVQIVDYLKCHPLLPILEKKMFSVCSTLFSALKQKPSLPASLL